MCLKIGTHIYWLCSKVHAKEFCLSMICRLVMRGNEFARTLELSQSICVLIFRQNGKKEVSIMPN